jgi:hypothetical protein
LVKVGLTEADQEKHFLIGSLLDQTEQAELTQFLRQNADVFAWRPYDCPGLDADVVYHKLHINKALTPTKQKPRRMAPEKAKAVEEEVQKLLEAGAIREAQFPYWISNPVVVKKSNSKWRVCVDFTDLNKACPKNNFPLP